MDAVHYFRLPAVFDHPGFGSGLAELGANGVCGVGRGARFVRIALIGAMYHSDGGQDIRRSSRSQQILRLPYC